jgi:sensor histidine kinase YesM
MTNQLIYAIFSKLIYFIVIYILIYYTNGKKEQTLQYDKTTILLGIVSATSIFVMVTIISVCVTSSLTSPLDFMIFLSGILLLLTNILVFSLNQYNQKKNLEFMNLQLQLQKEYDSSEYYKKLIKQNEEQNILIHDIKNHLQSIQLLCENKQYDKISSYIISVLNTSALQNNIHMCDHEMLNAILCRYKRECQDNSIDFRTDIRSKVVHNITDDDVTSLFCNLLDNAVDSALNILSAYIELNISKQENTPFIIISMINSCRSNPFPGKGKQLVTTKPDKLRHGYGLKSIQKIVDKYRGDIKMYYDKKSSSFHTIIIIKDPNWKN